MKGDVTAIVPAAGAGKRFGANKPFHPLSGTPVLIWCLLVMESVDEITEVIPVLKDADMEAGMGLFEKYGLSKVKKIAPGGKERQDSVWNALRLLPPDAGTVLVHDGARPLAGKELMSDAINALSEGFEGVVSAVPMRDTVKETETDGTVIRTIKRDAIWAVHTPQVFRYGVLAEAYEKAMSERFYSTDDSALIERYGGKVRVLMGSYENLKITGPEDIAKAECLIRERGLL